MAARKRAASRRKSRPAPRGRATSRAKAKPRRAAKPKARRAAAKRAPKRAAGRPAPKRTAAPSRRAAKPATRRAASGAVPNAIGLVNHHADYTTHDMPAMRRFYVEQLGFTRIQEMPGASYLSVQTGASSSVGFGPPSSGPPEQWRPPREPALYFRVADVDRAHRDLVARGVTFEQTPTDMPWGHRVAILRDPEGRTVYLAEDKTR